MNKEIIRQAIRKAYLVNPLDIEKDADEITEAVLSALTSTPAPTVDDSDVERVEKVARAIHNGLGGNGWAYSNYGYNEMSCCRKELFTAAKAVLSVIKPNAAVDDWFDISSAPKDGSRFLVIGEGEIIREIPVYDDGGGICDIDHHYSYPFEKGPQVCVFLKGENGDSDFFYTDNDLKFSISGYGIERYDSGKFKYEPGPDEWRFRITRWTYLPQPPKEDL